MVKDAMVNDAVPLILYSANAVVAFVLAAILLFAAAKNHFVHRIWRPIMLFLGVNFLATGLVYSFLTRIRYERILFGDEAADCLFLSLPWIISLSVSFLSSLLLFLTVVFYNTHFSRPHNAD